MWLINLIRVFAFCVSYTLLPILYDAFHFSNCVLSAGDKSPINPDKIDTDKYPDFKHTHPISAVVEPGDIVFIPAMWFHNVKAIDFSIAVNVFWYHLRPDQYDPKDVYGNKEPLTVQHASNSIATVCKRMNDLPINFRHVYVQQLIDKLKNTTLT